MNTTSADSWLDYIRRKELEIILSNLGDRVYGSALEIGSGSGIQSQILGKKFKVFISSDLKDQRRYFRKDNFIICDVQRLAFKNETFNFIFSSSVLEHVKLKEQCFSELKRVLKNGGLMVHAMPTCIWKLLFLFLHYPAMFKLVLCRIFNFNDIGGKEKSSYRNPNGVNKMSKIDFSKFLHYLRVFLYPAVHGAYANNVDELLKYRKKKWESIFCRSGFTIVKVINLYAYSPYMFFKFKFLKLREFLGKSDFTSCRAFVVKVE